MAGITFPNETKQYRTARKKLLELVDVLVHPKVLGDIKPAFEPKSAGAKHQAGHQEDEACEAPA